MPRLIDADKVAEYKASGVSDLTEWQKGWNDAIDTIMSETPTVDAEPVVRCKDCKYRFTNMGGWYKVCGLSDDCSCSLGERREDAETKADRNGYVKQNDLFPQGR